MWCHTERYYTDCCDWAWGKYHSCWWSCWIGCVNSCSMRANLRPLRTWMRTGSVWPRSWAPQSALTIRTARGRKQSCSFNCRFTESRSRDDHWGYRQSCCWGHLREHRGGHCNLWGAWRSSGPAPQEDVETKLHNDCRTGVYFNHPHAHAAAGVWGVDPSLLISHSVQLSSCLSHFCLCSGPTVTHCNLTLQGPLPTLPSFVPGRCSGLPSQGRVGRGALNTDLNSEETHGSIITPILSSLALQACLDSVPDGGTNFIWEIGSCKTN